MSRRRTCIAIAVLTITIALMLLQANANLYANGSGFITNSQASQANPNPPPTQAQKDEALKIAATSPLYKQYNTYPDESWSCGWAGVPVDRQGSPIDGHTVAVFKDLSDGSQLYISVDLNTGKIVSQSDYPSTAEYASPFSTAGYTSLPSTFLSIPSINTGNSLFNTLFSSPLTDNSEVQPSTTSGNNVALGQSQPFSLFSNTGLFNQPSGSNPSITQTQKDEAIKIASTSPLCQEYNAYPDNSWDFQWANSNNNHDIILSKTIGSKGTTPYGYLDFSVDLNTGTITTANFTDLNVKNNSTAMTPYQWQAGYTPKDFGFGFNY